MVSNNLGSNNKKIIAIIIALFVIIVGLIIGVVIVNNSRIKIDEEEYAEYLEKVEMDTPGFSQDIQRQRAFFVPILGSYLKTVVKHKLSVAQLKTEFRAYPPFQCVL